MKEQLFYAAPSKISTQVCSQRSAKFFHR